MKKTYTLPGEMPGDYEALTHAALNTCTHFTLVVRDRMNSKSAIDVLARLREFLIDEQDRSEWPGTRLLAGKARVFTHRLDASSARLLLEIGSAFSTWVEPNRPEDLAFLRADSSVWLAPIAHEGDVFLQLEDDELARLSNLTPQVVARLRAESIAVNPTWRTKAGDC